MLHRLRSIPSVDKSIKALLEANASLAEAPQSLLKNLVNLFWEKKRALLKTGKQEEVDLQKQLPALLEFVKKGIRPKLRKVLNASGVIIHTNLGRSILAEQACRAVTLAASSYCNLEMNLENGERGSRHELTCDLIRKLTGAEDAMVVNNNAAAVLLVLDTLCAGAETVVSRGELVEIGGSFRIPDIMLKSGTTLKEVGTTNRTHLEDYRSAINENTAAILRVHASNFRITGFHAAVPLSDLKTLALKACIPLIFDLGSGHLMDFSASGLPAEPTVKEIIAQGADIVCFSGDKALGGPQAGIIAGKESYIRELKRNPLARALRCDKLCLAALEATLRLYLDPEVAQKDIPTAAMINMTGQQLARAARSLASGLRSAFKTAHIACEVKTAKDQSKVGGGSFPECALPTTLVCLYPADTTAQSLRQQLLDGDPPLVGRLEKDAFCLDPRTIPKKEYRNVIRALTSALST